MQKIVINESPKREIWEKTITLSPRALCHYFVDWDFLETHEKTKKYQAIKLLGTINNRPVGILGGLLYKKFGLNHSLVSGSSASGGGLAVIESLDQKTKIEVAKKLILSFNEVAKKEKVLYTTVYCAYDINLDFGDKDLKYSPVIDLPKDRQDPLSLFDPKNRNHTRQGLRDCQIILGNRENLNDYLKLQKELADRRGLHYLNRLDDLNNLWDYLHPAGKLKLYLAKNEDKVLAGAIIFYAGKNLFYKNGASTAEGMKFRANNALQYQIISEAMANGYEIYDLEGGTMDANAPLYGITKFKLSLGAK